MDGREQPYINGNGTGSYNPTIWRDDVPEVGQTGTPLDEEHFNNMENGINSANLLVEFLACVVAKQQKHLSDIEGEVIEVTLKNTLGFYDNNSVTTVPLSVHRDTLNYVVDVEIQGETVNVGDVIVYDKQVNGFKIKFTGSASSVDLKLYVHGGNAA